MKQARELSLYGQYILEREGKHIVEDERGFATYTILSDAIYIEDIYVLPQFRSSNVASQYADSIAAIALSENKRKLIGSVCPAAKGSTASLKVLLAYGFILNSSDNNMIWFHKEL